MRRPSSLFSFVRGSLSCARDEYFVVFFEEAKEEALRLDAEFAATGRLKGPLHGVPISAKDQCMFFFLGLFFSVTGADGMEDTVVDVKGFDSTIGYTQWANKPAEHDAAVRFPNLMSLDFSSHTSLLHPPLCPPARPYTYYAYCIGRLEAPRSRRHNFRQDECPANAPRLRELQPSLGPHVQSVVGCTHLRRVVGRRGCAACGGRGGAWRRLGCWREYTHSVGVLWDLWS